MVTVTVKGTGSSQIQCSVCVCVNNLRLNSLQDEVCCAADVDVFHVHIGLRYYFVYDFYTVLHFSIFLADSNGSNSVDSMRSRLVAVLYRARSHASCWRSSVASPLAASHPGIDNSVVVLSLYLI